LVLEIPQIVFMSKAQFSSLLEALNAELSKIRKSDCSEVDSYLLMLPNSGNNVLLMRSSQA
jgi:hypothetical protein